MNDSFSDYSEDMDVEKILEELPREYDVIIIGTGRNQIQYEIEENIG